MQKITKRHGLVYIKKIDRKVGRDLIIKNHYSHKNVNTSTLYLGLYDATKTLFGVVSFGVAMNPIPTTKLVSGTKLNEYLELNRLWVDDCIKDNIESVFLGLCWKYIKANKPEVKWIQSFADGRVGVGTIYQATNFIYCGFHKSIFWHDPETNITYHNSILTRKTRKKYYELQKIKHRLERFEVKTYRYIYFLQRKYIKNLKLKSLPYPKKEREK